MITSLRGAWINEADYVIIGDNNIMDFNKYYALANVAQLIP